MTLNTQGPPTTSTSTPGTVKERNQCDPAALTVSEIQIVYWDVIVVQLQSSADLIHYIFTLKICIQNCKHVLASPLCYCIVLMVCLPLRSEVAILYNDRSVLENHHVSAAYRLMVEEDMNIFVNLNKDDWR